MKMISLERGKLTKGQTGVEEREGRGEGERERERERLGLTPRPRKNPRIHFTVRLSLKIREEYKFLRINAILLAVTRETDSHPAIS